MELHLSLGSLLQSAGDAAGALEAYREAAERFPEAWETHFNLAGALLTGGHRRECIASYEAVLRLRPDLADAHNCLGRAWHELGETTAARTSYLRAIALQQDHAEAISNLGALLMEMGELSSAGTMLRQAIRLQPGLLDAWCNLGIVLVRQRDLAGAVDCFRRVLTERPSHVSTLCSLGFLHDSLGDEAGALSYYKLALAADPNFPTARFNISVHLLSEGDLAAGWREYEQRWLVRQFASQRKQLEQPQWSGEDLQGKRIFVYSEQGFGDTLQFVRYVPLLQAMGAEVILEVQPALYDLLRNLPGAHHVLPGGAELPANFDYQCPLMSLPGAFGTTLETIPAAVPYIAAAAADLARWSGRIAGPGVRVGIVWSGNPEHTRDRLRSVALEQWREILEVKGATFYALQKGPGLAQLDTLPEPLRPIVLDAELKNFADTAAAITCLDLVICVDTAVAHLAGALGKPVWMLVADAADWRWLEQRTDSPWYPTAKLFRQSAPKEWGSVLRQVRIELETLVPASANTPAGSPENAAKDEARTVSAARALADPDAAVPAAAACPVAPAQPQPVPCKICGQPSPLLGVVDFNKSCIEAQGRRLPVAGVPVYYRRCVDCGFVFTGALDDWTHAEFERYIYNEQYITVDPDFAELRPTGNARLIAEAFSGSSKNIRVLDFGGGSGLLASRLRQEGFTAETYDPFSTFDQTPVGQFDLISCFEVMEHVPSPQQTVASMVALLKQPGGAILFSTLVLPDDFEARGLSWWYAAPRNGHVSLYSPASLARLFAAHGLRVGSFSQGMHIAYAEVPRFAAHLNMPV
jgi:Flp pilus assembly protein TadD/SAM-dependent methyltransferase